LDDMERLGGLEAAAASVPHVLQELLTGVDTTGRCKACAIERAIEDLRYKIGLSAKRKKDK